MNDCSHARLADDLAYDLLAFAVLRFGLIPKNMRAKPIDRRLDHRLKRPGLLEKMRRSGHDIEALLASQQTQRAAIEFENVMIQPSDDQQRRRLDMSKGLSGEVGAASARDDSFYWCWFVRGGDERRGGPRAGPE